MKKIKVLQMPIGNARGGITQYALQNWNFIDKSRFQFDFATRSKSLDFADELTAQGCKIHYLSCSSEEDEAQFAKEMRAVLDEGYDAIHLHTSYWKGFLVEELAIEKKCPIIIVHAHSTMIDLSDERQREDSIIKHRQLRETFPLEYATHFVACSSQAADWLFGEQIPRQRIQILKNAIDVPKFSFNAEVRKNYRTTLGLEDCFVLGHVGRFTYSKNHSMLLQIFKEVYQQNSQSRLVLIGAGELENDIRQQVKRFGLEHAVLFLGKRIDVPQLLQAMDIFLLPSHFEGLGLVLIEAQAAGLQCIASTSVASEAQITENLKFVPLSVSEWVRIILKTASGYDHKIRDDLISKAGYDLRDQIKVIENLYGGANFSEI